MTDFEDEMPDDDMMNDINECNEEDAIDDFFEYDMVMNDGKTFFGDDDRKGGRKHGGGCLTTIAVICLAVFTAILVLV